MSESFPTWLPLIGLLALALGVVRGAMLRSHGFVPRGRKSDTTSRPPSPVAVATARARIRLSRRTADRAPSTVQPGLAR